MMKATEIKGLPSAYDHHAAQEKWYAFWEERGYFHADAQLSISGEKPPFSVVIPPPNVTGALHLGHALNNTLQDILCRMRRMQGYNVLWMPGTDHAGIATQAVVERRLLEEEGKSRHDLGREGLVDRIWEWKAQYEKRITGQLKQLGCSCDWERQRFTLDDQCARAVRETFFKLFADGKIYRGKRLVNWDTYLQTAVSDDEVFHEEVKGHFWHFKYTVIDPQKGEPTHVTIATTRPETMLGDTAVAVHPDPAGQLDKVEAELKEKLAAAADKERPAIEAQLLALTERRQTHLPQLEQLRDMAARGVKLQLPLTDREIPLIADVWAKPELGSGCVKITPAHDANDYEVWQRSVSGDGEHIGTINILNPDGTLADTVPEKYRGLTMKKARTAVVDDLSELGLHDPETDREDRLIDLAHSDRSKTPIEPYLADQWFVKMDELAQSAMDAVTDGRVQITPQRYAKGYLDWLGEKRDWPIGRQLWWGHRIPVWRFAVDTVSEDNRETFEALGLQDAALLCTEDCDLAGEDLVLAPELSEVASAYADYHSDNPGIYFCVSPGNSEYEAKLSASGCVQSEEVLDTWFSSALWPFSTMGWPETTEELKAFYPTSVLITSRDIITLWVARMVLMGLYLDPLKGTGDSIPFPQVYIHPKILDGFGETMSKSKGNGVDPLDVIERFGADALRFGIAYLTTETQDVRMPVEFVCPHCGDNIKQTKKNRVLPRMACPSCSKEFSTQWAESDADRALPRAAVTSERFELGRNFANKLWNASRFALINLEGYEPSSPAAGDLLVEDRWLLSRLATVTKQVTEALETFRYADAARVLYDFAWNEFCSFYVEMTKARFQSTPPVGGVSDPEAGEQGIGLGEPSHSDDDDDSITDSASQKQVAQRVMAHALDTLLRLLHPMMPFLTEEVWQLLGEVAELRGHSTAANAEESVCIAAWPQVNESDIDADIEAQFAGFQSVLGAVREIRQSQNIPQKETLTFAVRCDERAAALLKPMQAYFTQMARATAAEMGPDAQAFDVSSSKTLGQMEVHVDVSQFIDVEAEKKRLAKEQANLTKFIGGLEGKLGNKGFVDNAPAEVIEAQRTKLAEAQTQLASVEAALAKL